MVSINKQIPKGSAVVQAGYRLYISGGFSSSKARQLFSLSSKLLINYHEKSLWPFKYHSIAHNHQILALIGGFCGKDDRYISKAAEIYCINSDKWKVAEPMIIPRVRPGAVFCLSHLYVFAGFFRIFHPKHCEGIERFHLRTNKWELFYTTNSISNRRAILGMCAVRIQPKLILLFGGLEVPKSQLSSFNIRCCDNMEIYKDFYRSREKAYFSPFQSQLKREQRFQSAMELKGMMGETSVLNIKNTSSFYYLNGYHLTLHWKGRWYSEEMKEGKAYQQS